MSTAVGWDWGPILNVAGMAFTSICSLVVGIYVARSKAKGEVQTSLDQKFEKLTDQLQEERKVSNDIIESQRERIDKDRQAIDTLYTNNRELRNEISELSYTNSKLTHRLEALRKQSTGISMTKIIDAQLENLRKAEENDD